LKAETSNIARTYQQFVDRNIALKKRENELLKTVNELEAKRTELQKSLSQSESQDNNTDNTNVILKARLEEIIATSDASIQRSSLTNNYHKNEYNEVHFYSPQVELSSRKTIFDTKDWF
jgi:hypothetical protein